LTIICLFDPSAVMLVFAQCDFADSVAMRGRAGGQPASPVVRVGIRDTETRAP